MTFTHGAFARRVVGSPGIAPEAAWKTAPHPPTSCVQSTACFALERQVSVPCHGVPPGWPGIPPSCQAVIEFRHLEHHPSADRGSHVLGKRACSLRALHSSFHLALAMGFFLTLPFQARPALAPKIVRTKAMHCAECSRPPSR